MINDGVSYDELRDLVHRSFSDAELISKTNQRIANKSLAAQKEQQDDAEAEAFLAEELAKANE